MLTCLHCFSIMKRIPFPEGSKEINRIVTSSISGITEICACLFTHIYKHIYLYKYIIYYIIYYKYTKLLFMKKDKFYE